MKTILNAFVAVALIASVAGSAAHAFDAKTFWEQQDKQAH